MIGNHRQNANEHSIVHIRPERNDIIVISITIFVFICILTASHWDILRSKLEFSIFVFLVYMLIRAGRACQRASIDSQKLRFYILGFIPIDIFWDDVSQIGIVYVLGRYSSGKTNTKLMGEMFVIVRKPCENFKEGCSAHRWWYPRPRWKHPLLVQNIFCKTSKYKEIVEHYSRKKISFEIEYRY